MSKNQTNVEDKKSKKKEKKKKHKILRGIIKTILIILLIIVLFVAGFVGYSTYKNGWGVQGLLQTAVGSETELEDLEEFKILILGVSEDISAALTDTIMVASYNPQTQKAVLLSIPRDTFIGDSTLYADSYDKINALYQQDGAEAVVEEVNDITGLDIEYYMVISNNALVELVDEIGGVEFDVPIDMDYDSDAQDLHIHLEAGLQTLTGEQAEWLVRFRKNNDGTGYSSEYGSDDYGRMKTQQEFLKAVFEQTIQAQNITKIGSLVDIVKENVTTNISDWDAIKEYIPYAVDFSLDGLETATLPGESARIPANTGLWFFIYDEYETEELIEELYSTDTTEDEGETDISEIQIELLNGSGDSTLLTEVTTLLKEEGYNVYKTGTTTTTSKSTIINRTSVSSSVLSDIEELLETDFSKTTSSDSSSTVDITIILGKDYGE